MGGCQCTKKQEMSNMNLEDSKSGLSKDCKNNANLNDTVNSLFNF